MRHTLRQVFRSSKFVTGFTIFTCILLIIIIYPLIVPGNPLEMIGLGTFFKPGIYVSVYDGLNTELHTLKLSDAAQKRIDNVLSTEDRVAMVNWLTAVGVPEEDIDKNDTEKLLTLWWNNYDPSIRPQGMTKALRNYYERLNRRLESIKSPEDIIIANTDGETGEFVAMSVITDTDYINISDIPNVRILPLGTDNFGRDVLKELVSAAKTSILIGLIAGSIATFIGLTLGLLAGFIGEAADDTIMFFTNTFTSIPLCHTDTYLLQYRSGATRCYYSRHRHRMYSMDMDLPFRAFPGYVAPQPGPCNLSRISGHSLSGSYHRHPAVHRFLCRYGADPSDIIRYSCRSAALAARTRAQDH